MIRSLFPLLMLGAPALAQVNECQEAFSECREDCSIEHSSLKGNAPTKLNKCIKKCQKKLTACEERDLETKTNALEAGSLDKTPTSKDVDEAGLPTRTSSKRASDDDERRPSPGDDLRDDRPAPAADEPKKTKKTSKSEEPELKRPPREEVRDSEVPKSSRTELKVDERDAKKNEPVTPVKETKPSDPVVAKRSEPEPPPKRAEEPPPPPKTEKKKDDLPPEPKKPKEEDHDDLRNY